MKKSFLFILTILPFFCSAQEFEHTFTKINYSRNLQMKAHEELIAVAGSAGFCNQASLWLFNQEGEELWNQLPNIEYSRFSSLTISETGQILTAGTSFESDEIGYPSDGIKIYSFDLSGNQLYSRKIPISNIRNNHTYRPTVPLAIVNDSTFIVGVLNQIRWLDLETGDTLEKIEYPVENFIVLQKYEDQIIALDKRKLLLLDENGTITEDVNFYENLTDFAIQNDTIWIGGTHHLYRKVGNQLDSLLLDDILEIKGLEWDIDENLLVWGQEEQTNLSLVQKINSNFLIQENFSLQDSLYIAENLLVHNNQYLIGGRRLVYQNDNLGYGNQFVPFLGRKFSLQNFTFPTYANIGVSDISFSTDAYISDSMMVGPNIIVYHIENASVAFEMEVTNFSDTIINSFSYASESLGGFFCFPFQYMNHVENANLAPNESMTVSGEIYFWSDVTSTQFDFCCYAYSPNQKFDENFHNNSICFDLTLTDTDEIYKRELDFSVFPNPTTSDIQVQGISTDKLLCISIYSSTGKLLKQLSSFENTSIPLTDLSQGIYFLEVHDGTKKGMRRFVKL